MDGRGAQHAALLQKVLSEVARCGVDVTGQARRSAPGL